MRTFVPWGPMAISVLALAAPLAAQGRGRDQQDNNRGQARAQQESRFRTDGRTNGVGRRQMDDRARGQARAQAPAREQARVQAQDRARVDVRARDQARAQWGRTPADNRGRVNDRGRVYDNGGRVYDRGREAERWGGDARWREDHARIVVQFFSSPRYHYAPRYAYQSLPYGWDRVVYENGYFPPEYDAWCDNVPVDLEYQLPPLYRGYRRFIFGDRLIVIDRITRNIVLVVRI